MVTRGFVGNGFVLCGLGEGVDEFVGGKDGETLLGAAIGCRDGEQAFGFGGVEDDEPMLQGVMAKGNDGGEICAARGGGEGFLARQGFCKGLDSVGG
ncbi:MAG: hypothetical protein MOGMAGMI_02532 [Candidatus Omnitrophica bacterium]|nr:hypothetical protein [Candidatus Omnitrophota bacterium]